jgi:hypothetical protein
LDYYDLIGEINFACDFYAKMLSRVRLFPATLEDDGTLAKIDSGLPVDLLARIQDPGGKRSQLQFDYGRLKFITGEGILLVTGENSDDERWRFLWRDEVRIYDDGRAVRLSFQGQPVNDDGTITGRETGDTGTAYRMWTPHPRWSDLATSPMRAVQTICEELIILTDSVRSTAVSRLTNGILALASELSPSPEDVGADEDPNQNIFLADYIEHVQAQIDNPGSAAALTPFLLEGSFDYIREGIRWIQTHDPATDYMERDLRVEAVKRLALGLDFPPETLLGMTEANHWTALQVKQDTWQSYGSIIAEDWVHDLAQAYLRPALRDAGYADWEDVVIGFDDSQVVTNPDRSADADSAYDRGNVSDKGFRHMKGIPEDFAPSQEEKDRYLAIKLRDPAIIGEGVAPVNERGPAQPASETAPVAAPAAPSNGRVVSRQEALRAAVEGASHLALAQCRSKAGARLRQRHRSCADCVKKIDGLENSLVASALGMRKMKTLGETDYAALVEGGTADFRGLLDGWGLPNQAAESLCARVELYAAQTLLEEKQPDLPPGFVAQVELSLEEVAA